MNSSELQQIFTDALKAKLIGKDNITDVKVEMRQESSQDGEMSWECNTFNTVNIFVKYGQKRKWVSYF